MLQEIRDVALASRYGAPSTGTEAGPSLNRPASNRKGERIVRGALIMETC